VIAPLTVVTEVGIVLVVPEDLIISPHLRAGAVDVHEHVFGGRGFVAMPLLGERA
jgi:hypothetical protein